MTDDGRNTEERQKEEEEGSEGSEGERSSGDAKRTDGQGDRIENETR